MPPVAVDVPGSDAMILLPPSAVAAAGAPSVALSGAANVAVAGWAITPMPASAKSVTAFVRAERLVVTIDKVLSPSVLMEGVCAPSLRAFTESLYVR